jgi:hypothetical protein
MEDLIMKKLIMFVMVLAIAASAMALQYPDVAPDFAGCDNSAWVIWEFLDDGCMPTSTVLSATGDPYSYNPEPVDPLTFGSRHWDDPTEDSGWGGSYGEDLWTYSDGKYTVEAEDSFNQSIPHRGEKAFLRQYFQVVHTMPAGADPEVLGLIGMGLELWDMSVYEENGWTGCPVGYEGLSGDGYLGGDNYKAPMTIDHGNGWYTSIWITDFWDEEEATTVYAADEAIGLYEATHAVCIIGMDLDRPAQLFQIEEVILDFIWFNEPDGSDIPEVACEARGGVPPLDIVPVVVYEPQDEGGPPPMGPVSDDIQVKLKYRPGELIGEPNFICTVVVDPDPNVDHIGSADFSLSDPCDAGQPSDPNGNITLTFTQANWDVYQNVTVTATQDLDKEGDESFSLEFTVTINISDCNFGGPGCDPVVQRKGIMVADNDIPYISVLPYGALMNVLTENTPGVPVCVNVTLSHKPTHNVEIRGALESEFELIYDTVVMDPNFEDWTDPNHLLFDPCNYNVNQTICLTVLDDEEHPDTDLEWIPGQILLNGTSKDIRYQAEGEDGELEEETVRFNVQDNDCGAWGYDAVDINQDCVINLGEVALLYSQWLLCTEPYDDGGVCDKLWNLVEEE